MENWRKDIRENLKLEGKLLLEEQIAPYTTFRIGGRVSAFLEPESIDDVLKLAEFLNTHPDVEYQILGGGSNVLYPDHYKGLVIHLGKALSQIAKKGDSITVGAGIAMHKVVVESARWNLSGIEFMAGIPGSIGGAIKGNAGAFRHCISEKLEIIKGIDLKDASEKVFEKKQISWGYRSSNIPDSFLITEVTLTLNKDNEKKSFIEIERILKLRKDKHPQKPSAGSVFLNPEPPKVIAGRLIEQLGFKGRRIGDAMCSPMHANFIVNTGEATQKDVLDLINEIKRAVAKSFGIQLREEIKIIRNKEQQMEENNG